jgi:type IV secretory pathway TrbF-like protein
MKISADGQVVLLEPAKPLREFVIPPEAVQFMLTRFLVDLRRVSLDTVVNQDARRNVQASVCGPDAKTISTPAVREAHLVVVHVESVHQGASARTWHADWRETWYDAQVSPRGEHRFRADLTLARRDLDWGQKDSVALFARNPISLCLQHAAVYEVPSR